MQRWNRFSRRIDYFSRWPPTKTKVIQDNLTRTILGGGGNTITIGERMRDHGFKNGSVDEFRVFNRVLSSLEIQECYEPGTLTKTIQSGTDFHGISDYLTSNHKNVLQHHKQLRNLCETRNKLIEKSAEIMVMRESPQPKQAYVLTRGEYDKRAEPVSQALQLFFLRFLVDCLVIVSD